MTWWSKLYGREEVKTDNPPVLPMFLEPEIDYTGKTSKDYDQFLKEVLTPGGRKIYELVWSYKELLAYCKSLEQKINGD